jgi:hypothetical protein
MTFGCTIQLLQALLLITHCQFFLIDPTARHLLTNQTSGIDAQHPFSGAIISQNEILQQQANENFGKIEKMLNGSLKQASK